ncbi:MAG: preprotein translocase subunit YajC [Streptosporangiaceae bacterium]
MGIETAAAAATKSSGSSTFLILIVVFIGLIYFMAIRPGRNRQKKAAQQQNTLRPGARVRTTAGMYATVVAVDGDDVVLEVAPDVEVRYIKRAIMEVLTPGDEPAEDDAEHEEGGWPEPADAAPDDAEYEGAGHEDAEHEDAVADGTAGHETVAQADGEHGTEPDLSVPAGNYGDDLVINGQRDASANGKTEPAAPGSSASKE